MSRKRSNAGSGVYTLASFAVLAAALALTAAPALALPEGRHYELVSPPYKGGYGAKHIEAVAPDGESVAFISNGAFAGAPSSDAFNEYVARRGASGWSTAPMVASAALAPNPETRDVSSTLGTALAFGKTGGPNEVATFNGTEEAFLLHSTDSPDTQANWEVAGKVIETLGKEYFVATYEGGSADFCHLFFHEGGGAGHSFAPEAFGMAAEGVYELDRGCGGEPVSVRLLGLDNEGKPVVPSCQAELGFGTGPFAGPGVASAFNAISQGGGEVFFTTGSAQGSGCGQVHQLFVRLGGERTLEVSKPLGEECRKGAPAEVPCEGAPGRASAHFVGASRNGSRVFFTTTAPLTGGKEEGKNLYMASIGCPSAEGEACVVAGEAANTTVTSLVQVSHDPNVGGAAGVQGVVRLAPDGSRVYFVAAGDLLSGAERATLQSEGRPVPHLGADNMYLYERDARFPEGHMSFIADLCSGLESSGSVSDLRCPSTGSDSELWGHVQNGEVQTAGVDGRFLVFSTSAQLVSGDTDQAQDVYRYDAETGALERVSVGEGGHDANGNGSYGATIKAGHFGTTTTTVRDEYEMDNRAVSEDGSRIVFTSAEPLSENAINHLENAYEWHKEPGWSEGRVSLVSTGSATEPLSDVTISPAGNDVFFVTSQGLVPQDTDGAPDVYDARLGAGFPPAPAEEEECSGDACQGPLTNPAPLLVPGSVSQPAGGNFPAPAPAPAVKPKAKPAKCKKGYVKKKGRCVKKPKARKSNRGARS
jgi:hypothetical protein